MLKYIIKRLLTSVITIFFIMLITFLLMESLPGMPTMDRRMQTKLGLHDPLFIKFLRYMRDILTGDFGSSMSMAVGARISQLLFQRGRIRMTLGICGYSLLITLAVGVPLGCIAAQYKDRLVDQVIRVLSTLLTSVPMFVLAVFCIMYLAVHLKIFPVRSCMLEEPAQWGMPLICMATANTFNMARKVRVSVLEVMGEDYIRTARAKGVPERRVLFRHTLRNGLIPVITHVGVMIPEMFLGVYVVESTFAIPGFGTYLTYCISSRDYSLIMATTYVFAVFIVAVYFVVDICYALADPRISFEGNKML